MNRFFPIFLFFASNFLLILTLFENPQSEKDENLQKVKQGHASIIHYQDHSYVVWSINSGGGICHNPDCKCCAKKVVTHE